MTSLAELTKLAAIIGVITSGAGILMKYDLDKKLRNTITYKKALEKVYNHETTVEHLGKPIKEGRVRIGNSKDDNTRNFSVNLKGSNTNGKLNCEFIINEPDKKTELTKLEIKFADLPNKNFVLHEIQ